MRKKLLALNLLLLALLALGSWRLYENWRSARDHRQTVLGKPAPKAPQPGAAPVSSEPLRAAGYLDVAERFLFSKDRNPDVIIDVEAPKPVPPLPVAYGVLDFGGGPTAILSPRPGASQRSYRVGEMIGEFLLAEAGTEEIVFEWEGKRIRKRLEELAPRPSEASAPQESAQAPAAPPPPPAAATSLSPAELAAPGVDLGGQVRGCQPGDTSPAGTVRDGYRKVVTVTPFGSSCRWELVR